MGIDLVIQYLPELLKASLTTLALVLSCIALGFILASLFTHCLESTSSFNYILSYPLRALIFFVRGTPILVQLFLWKFVNMSHLFKELQRFYYSQSHYNRYSFQVSSNQHGILDETET